MGLIYGHKQPSHLSMSHMLNLKLGDQRQTKIRRMMTKKKQGKLTKMRVAMHCSGCGGAGHTTLEVKGKEYEASWKEEYKQN